MLKKQGVDPKRVLGAVAATPLWNPHLTRDAESMLSDYFEPHFPIELLTRDLDYTVDIAGRDPSAPTVSAARIVFRKAANKKPGDLNVTAVVKLFDKSS